MAEPLKLMYNQTFLQNFATKIQSVYPPFDGKTFIRQILNEEWESLELKARMRRISTILGTFLPSNFIEALHILYKINHDCVGFPYLIFPDFVEVYGQHADDYEAAIDALERFTSKSSSEFAIRSFLLREPERTMTHMRQWAISEDEHVRRLASEGCRPRLPWGQALPMFKADPAPVLEILEQLKADPSLYVRKSVANNLNDIAKDHPEIVKQIASDWYGSHPFTDWIVLRGCRSLMKKADPDMLQLFGYTSLELGTDTDSIQQAELHIEPKQIAIGESVDLEYRFVTRPGETMRVRIEYAIDFVKASGKASRKIFRLTDRVLEGGTSLTGTKKHRFADLTTRRHYPGEHRILLMINGQPYAEDLLVVH
ncbi:DNA alkylation repair protein [Saccharibacillus sp. JS10]|uniref:DNA alkylation repair protein n=1 Tax=Saccharibacillus sp. JS10 TaxID=2950552 RepID=UPI00210D6FB7|nr:DNA alkylation repair protein [Saccharibacillus sp. JS10]MCQ4085851.1 DNA alkylation repair protein [Saccharibacillus sp. JS10]